MNSPYRAHATNPIEFAAPASNMSDRRRLLALAKEDMLIQTIWCFVTDESGDMDALTVFSLIIGFIAAIAMLNGTVVQLFAAIFGMLPVH